MLIRATPILRPAVLTSAPITPGRRFASHGPPAYNQPSGYIFGEKVSQILKDLSLCLADTSRGIAAAKRAETEMGVVGVSSALCQPWCQACLSRLGMRARADTSRVRPIYYVGMFGSMAGITLVYIYKPDTRWV